MSKESLSLEDLLEHETDPVDVQDGTEPEYFQFTFRRDDDKNTDHKGYPAKVTPVATSDIREVRASEDDGWRFFAEIRTKKDRFGSKVTYLLEDNDGEIQDVLLDSGEEIELLRPVTINSLE